MGFWSKHRRTILITTGVLGCGYGLYRFYSSIKQTTLELDNDLFGSNQDSDKLIRDALQSHFENIQRISETITLPHAMGNLRSRINQDFDLSPLFEKLMQGRVQGQQLNKPLQMNEKLKIWDKLKILSFMKLSTSVWAMVVTFLYVRVQANILGRQLYIETARGFLASEGQDESITINHHAQKVFLETSDFLTKFGFSSLISQMEMATTHVLRNMKLTEYFNPIHLSQIIMEILGLFINNGKSDSWVNCVLPLNAACYQNTLGMLSNRLNDPNMPLGSTTLDQLLSEARNVLLSIEFRNIVDSTTRIVIDGLMDDLLMELNGGNINFSDKHPLVKLLPQVALLSNAVIEEVGDNKCIKVIRSIPDVELFFTLLYTDIPQQPMSSFSESIEPQAQHQYNEDRKSVIIATQNRKIN